MALSAGRIPDEPGPAGARTRLAFYLLGSYLAAMLFLAFASPGPEQLIVNSFLAWGGPAALATIQRERGHYLSRFITPVIWLAAMIFLFFVGNGIIEL